MAFFVKISYFLCAVSLLVACSKDDPADSGNPDPDTIVVDLLKKIEWDNGLTADCIYGADSTLQRIDYRLGNIGGQTIYGWTGKKMTEIYDSRSLYKNVYHYDNQNRLSFIKNTVKQGTESSAYTLEFTYSVDGKVETMKYYAINEAGKQLKTSSTYHYHENGALHEVLTENNSLLILHRIDSYATEMNFSPFHYIQPTLDENYTIYNLPVLTQMKSLPARITRLVTEPDKPTYTDKIEENNYHVQNRRIDSVDTRITVPGVPGTNHLIRAAYSY